MPKKNNPGCNCCGGCLPCPIPPVNLNGTYYYARSGSSGGVGTSAFTMTHTTTNPGGFPSASDYWDSGPFPIPIDDVNYTTLDRWMRVFLYCHLNVTTFHFEQYPTQADALARTNPRVISDFPNSFGNNLCAPSGCTVYNINMTTAFTAGCPDPPPPRAFKVTE